MGEGEGGIIVILLEQLKRKAFEKTIIVLTSIIIIIVATTGCVIDDTDPLIKHYFYIKIANPDAKSFVVIAPLTKSVIITENLAITTGNGSLEINENRTVEIKSSSPNILISATFNEYESLELINLISSTIFCNSTGNISIIIQSKEKYEYKERDSVFRSDSIINRTVSYPVKNDLNWNTPLSNDFLVPLTNGWSDYGKTY